MTNGLANQPASARAAIVRQFNVIYGTDENSLSSWHGLCEVIGIAPPPTLEESRQRVRQTHVNLVDLVDTPRTGIQVMRFPTLKKAEGLYYTKTEKFFPKEDAYAGGLLRVLLRELLGVYRGRRKR